MSAPKRSRTDSVPGHDHSSRPTKRQKDASVLSARPASKAHCASSLASPPDRLSSLSDELLVRILHCLALPQLLALSPVSRRFHRLADDTELWKALYCARFVLPRVPRLGIGRRARRGAYRASTQSENAESFAPTARRPALSARPVDWKRQYKLRHNWARGQCAVEELRLDGAVSAGADPGSPGLLPGLAGLAGLTPLSASPLPGPRDIPPRMFVKVLDGIAVTADAQRGLQVWELKTRSLMVRARLQEQAAVGGNGADINTTAFIPTALSVDASRGSLDIAIGRQDGGFDIWRLDEATRDQSIGLLTRTFSHRASTNGPLVAIAYVYPFVLTATEQVSVSLYAWAPGESPPLSPTLITSLRSHTSHPPLALSIRRLATVTIASIAYTVTTPQGWAAGIQDLHIQLPASKSAPHVVTTRLAVSIPMTGLRTRRPRLAHASLLLSPQPLIAAASAGLPPSFPRSEDADSNIPIALCYSHPYLLAVLPDNTLTLHICTSTTTALVVSPGIRLWGHTSGISDAEITARGKVVSVSSLGDEMRVWELEGGPAAERGRSVTIRPSIAEVDIDDARGGRGGCSDTGTDKREDRRNWVGFDDEMVIVLEERCDSGERLMVYDFT